MERLPTVVNKEICAEICILKESIEAVNETVAERNKVSFARRRLGCFQTHRIVCSRRVLTVANDFVVVEQSVSADILLHSKFNLSNRPWR